MPFSDDAKLKMLRHVLGKDDLMLGLLSNGQEVSTTRRPVHFDAVGDVEMANAAEVRFEAMTDELTVNGWFVVDGEGAEVMRHPCKGKQFEFGEEPVWRVGSLVARMTTDD